MRICMLLAIFVLVSLSPSRAQVSIDDPAKQVEAIAKMCRGEFQGIIAENVNQITINGNTISVDHSKNGMNVKKSDGSLIEGITYGTATEYVDCLERLSKTLGVRLGQREIEFKKIVASNMPCSTLVDHELDINDRDIYNFYLALANNIDDIVFIDFSSWVGAGCEHVVRGFDAQNDKNFNNISFGIVDDPDEMGEYELSDPDFSEFIAVFDFSVLFSDETEILGDRLSVCATEKIECPRVSIVLFPKETNAVLVKGGHKERSLRGFVRVGFDGAQGYTAFRLSPVGVTDSLLVAFESSIN